MYRLIRVGAFGIAMLLPTGLNAQQKAPAGQPGQAPPSQSPPSQTPGQTQPSQLPPGQTQPSQLPPGQTQPSQLPPGQTRPGLQTGQTQPGQSASGANNSTAAGVSQNPWFANNAIQQQLNLSQQQSSQLNRIYTDQLKNYQQQLSSLPTNLSGEQRALKERELQQNFYNSFNSATSGIFTNPQQQQRYNQLHWQYRNYAAFEDPGMQQKLNLSATQRQQLSQYESASQKQMDQIRQNFANNPTEAAKQFAAFQQQNTQNINSVLTPQQISTYQGMVGDPYAFQPGQYFQSTPYKSVNPSGSNK